MYSKDGYDSKIFRKWGLILGTNQSLQAGMKSVIGGLFGGQVVTVLDYRPRGINKSYFANSLAV